MKSVLKRKQVSEREMEFARLCVGGEGKSTVRQSEKVKVTDTDAVWKKKGKTQNILTWILRNRENASNDISVQLYLKAKLRIKLTVKFCRAGFSYQSSYHLWFEEQKPRAHYL